MAGSSKWYMTAPQLAGVALGLFVIIGIALAVSRQNGTTQTATIVVDTVYTDTTSHQTKKPATKKPKKKKEKKQAAPPQQRDYRDEVVSQ